MYHSRSHSGAVALFSPLGTSFPGSLWPRRLPCAFQLGCRLLLGLFSGPRSVSPHPTSLGCHPVSPSASPRRVFKVPCLHLCPTRHRSVSPFSVWHIIVTHGQNKGWSETAAGTWHGERPRPWQRWHRGARSGDRASWRRWWAWRCGPALSRPAGASPVLPRRPNSFPRTRKGPCRGRDETASVGPGPPPADLWETLPEVPWGRPSLCANLGFFPARH